VGPDGRIIGARFPDGSIRAPLAGDVVAANTVVAADGMVLGPDGRPMGKILPWNDLVVAFNGMIIGKRIPDGTVRGLRPGDALEPATTIHPDGTVTSPDGRRLGQMRADGMVVKPDGHILGMMTPNGAIVIPGPGDVLHPNSTVTPDGMALDAQGRPLGRVMPDGVVIGPDGAPIGMINADGFIGAMPPPGANLFTGTTLKQGKQFGPQIVLDSLGRVLGRLSGSGNNMVMGPDGQTSIGVRGPNGNIRYASMQDLDPSRGPPKNFSGKSHSMSAAQRDRARKFGPVPRCCGIPLGKLGQKFSNPLTWPALLLFSPVLIPLGVLFGMFKGCGLLGTGCKGFGRSCDKGCLDPACCGSCAPMCQPCFSACGFPDVAKNGLPRCEVGCARVVDTCKGGHCMEAMCTGCNCCSCFGCNAAAFSWPKCFQCVVQMSVGAGCLAPGRSLLALFVNTAALLWLFVYVLIEVIWNWGLSVDTCEHFGWFNASPSPDHWLLLTFAIVGIVIVALFFMYNVFVAPPPPPRSAIEAENAKVARRGKICTYASIVLLFLAFGGVLLYFTLACTELGTQAPEISRLAWLILFMWSTAGILGLLLVLFICCDCAISGRMRVVVMFTDKQSAFAGAAGTTAGAAKVGLAQKFVGASQEDVGRLHRHGSDFDRVSNWGPPNGGHPMGANGRPLGPQGAVGYQEPLVGPRGNMPPPQFAMDRNMRV